MRKEQKIDEFKTRLQQSIDEAVFLQLQNGIEPIAAAFADEIVADIDGISSGAKTEKTTLFEQLAVMAGSEIVKVSFKMLDEIFDDDD